MVLDPSDLGATTVVACRLHSRLRSRPSRPGRRLSRLAAASTAALFYRDLLAVACTTICPPCFIFIFLLEGAYECET